MESIIKLLETLERISEFEEDYSRLKYDTAFYVQEKPTLEFLQMMSGEIGGSTAVLPNVKISTKKVIEAILEHLELKLDYTTGKNPDVALKKLEARNGKQT